MGDDATLPKSMAHTNLDLNGDLDNIDPFKPKKALANSPPTQRKNTAKPDKMVVQDAEQIDIGAPETTNDGSKNEVAVEKPKKAPVKSVLPSIEAFRLYDIYYFLKFILYQMVSGGKPTLKYFLLPQVMVHETLHGLPTSL